MCSVHMYAISEFAYVQFAYMQHYNSNIGNIRFAHVYFCKGRYTFVNSSRYCDIKMNMKIVQNCCKKLGSERVLRGLDFKCTHMYYVHLWQFTSLTFKCPTKLMFLCF